MMSSYSCENLGESNAHEQSGFSGLTCDIHKKTAKPQSNYHIPNISSMASISLGWGLAVDIFNTWTFCHLTISSFRNIANI